ncbi:MAG: Uncharacterised protein [Flavobacteriaceae bacterium]|nr:MAG: Uncharacterised protein [Flavobacteriaceae bacterium]|tara:strand:- start:24304 stop:24531 length:228 start_codon:yes stop_codon:yes gene_type:complete
MKKGNKSLKLDKTEELELLLDLNPPNQLKESVNYVFFEYLKRIEGNDLPDNFKEICSDIDSLLQFLKTISQEETK